MRARQERGHEFAPNVFLVFTPKVKYSGVFFWVQLKTKSFLLMVYAMSACEAADIAKPKQK